MTAIFTFDNSVYIENPKGYQNYTLHPFGVCLNLNIKSSVKYACIQNNLKLNAKIVPVVIFNFPCNKNYQDSFKGNWGLKNCMWSKEGNTVAKLVSQRLVTGARFLTIYTIKCTIIMQLSLSEIAAILDFVK